MKSSRSERRKRRRRKQDAAANLSRRVQQQFPDQKVVVGGAHDGVKMSEVLEEFIAPYREFADTEEAFRKLLVTAVIAWNTALFSAEEREAHLEKMLEAFPEEVRAGTSMDPSTRSQTAKEYHGIRAGAPEPRVSGIYGQLR